MGMSDQTRGGRDTAFKGTDSKPSRDPLSPRRRRYEPEAERVGLSTREDVKSNRAFFKGLRTILRMESAGK